MQALQKQLLDYSGGLMSSPDGGTGGMKLAAANQVNKNYANMPRTVTSQLSGRGFGKSGKLGKALYDVEGSRLGDLSGLESSFGQMALNQRNQGASIGEQLLNQGSGREMVGAGSAGGNGLMSAGNGLGNIASMLMMSKILGGSSGGYGNMNTSGGGGMS